MSTHTDTPAQRSVPFHRLATVRPAWARWHTPLLTLGAAFLAYLVLISVVLVLAILVLALVPGENVTLGVASGDPTSPLDVTLALAMGAAWVPAGMIGVRFGGWRPLGTIWSVAARVRRELLGPYGAWGAAMGAAVVAVAAVAGALAGTGGGSAAAGASVPQLLLVTVVVLVLAPLQAIGLEMTLRGAVMQAVGTWLRSPVPAFLAATAVVLIGRELTAAVVVPALALALTAAVLAWKTGGLELPIVLSATVMIASHLVSAVGAGTGAGAGAAALNAAAAAPGTSSAALTETAAQAGGAALAGGVGAAVALLVLAGASLLWISSREGIGLLQPVSRGTDQPAPEPVPF
ncbi:CAAX protease [Brachybacterium saurashtrense]|uniref:CAAX protease n=1 Tax=Brachybacterium saurashtrense TaxID=556288 RepID=A0A345YSD8_9MICO|nr:CAAX protease [Brachybacterium saurashtrense]AXK46840.1 CAAX protease [Brachybacterium saurashtrense]RRR22555.1 CAAX protease [Brachybacterium saurashtrense]